MMLLNFVFDERSNEGYSLGPNRQWINMSSSSGLEPNRHIYHKTSNIRRTLVANKIVDRSDVVGASPVGAAPTTSSIST